MLQLLGFIIDCPDPMKLAAFYSQVTGRAIVEGSGGSTAAVTFGEVDLAFQRVADYRPPRWPDSEHPKQYHLDFEVGEIEPEGRRVVELGATLQQDFIGPDGYGWQVYTDPAGHPFCLCRHEGVTWTTPRWCGRDADQARFPRRPGAASQFHRRHTRAPMPEAANMKPYRMGCPRLRCPVTSRYTQAAATITKIESPAQTAANCQGESPSRNSFHLFTVCPLSVRL